jgi:mycothiol synthase
MTMADGCVAPERTGEGIGTFLLTWARKRASELVTAAPDDARVIFAAGVDAEHPPSIALLEDQGMRLRRYFLEMRIDFDGPVPEPVFPEGISIRTIEPGVDDVEAWRAVDEAFQDHFGHVERPEEAGLARLRTWMSSPSFDQTLWWMAVDGEEFAANCWCLGSVEDDDRIGYVASLGVRKPWRGKGLAKALLRYAFTEFQRRGKTAATLHVDAESLTGATKLYESVGMRESDRFAAYEIELRAGEDLQVS